MSKSQANGAGRVILHFDGASRGNPGPSAAGILITAEDGTILLRRGVSLSPGTNNVAEYKGLLFGLEECQRLGASRVSVISDSELIVKQMTGSYRVRNAKLRYFYEKVGKLIAGFEEVVFRAVPRGENAAADALCNLVLKKGRSFRDDLEEPGWLR